MLVLVLVMYMCMQADPTILPDKGTQSIMCYSHSALYKPGGWILHAEHFQSMFAVSREVLPHAFHFGLPGHSTTKIFISVAPEEIWPHPSLAAKLQEEMHFGLHSPRHAFTK